MTHGFETFENKVVPIKASTDYFFHIKSEFIIVFVAVAAVVTGATFCSKWPSMQIFVLKNPGN